MHFAYTSFDCRFKTKLSFSETWVCFKVKELTVFHQVSATMYQSIDENDDRLELGIASSPTEASEQDLFLKYYKIFSCVTAVCLASVMFTSIFLLIVDTKINTVVDFSYLLLRLYGLTFNCIAFMCEMEWLETIRQSTIFQNWVFRGIFYSYLGIFTFVEYGKAIVFTVNLSWIVEVGAAGLTFLGLVYTIMVRYPDKIVDEAFNLPSW